MRQQRISLGIDLARRAKHLAVLVDHDDPKRSTGKKAFSFAHDREGFCAARDYVLKRIGAESLEGVMVNIEPTSGVWEVASAFFNGQGADVYYSRTDVVSGLRKAQSKHVKTDRIDARALATLPFVLPERAIRTVKKEARLQKLGDWSSQRRRLSDNVTQWKNRFVAKVEKVWTPLLLELKEAERFCVLAQAFFKRFPMPDKVVQLGQERFVQWCMAHAHGNTNAKMFETLWNGAVKSAELWEAVEAGGWITIDWKSFKDLLVEDLRIIELLEEEIKKVEKKITVARKDVPEADLLQQLPGVGDIVSATLATILAPSNRFPNAKKCGAYTGYTCRRTSSGNKDVQGMKITKTGNRRLKRDLALAADVAMRHDAQLAQFAIRLLSKGKHYNKVRVAVGRKIALRAYSLLKRYEQGQTDVAFQWRDTNNNPIDKHQAKQIAEMLWSAYEEQK